jgi:hypothetical protein
MARPRGIVKVTCPNPRCRYYHKEKGKTLSRKGEIVQGIRDISALDVTPILLRHPIRHSTGNTYLRAK